MDPLSARLGLLAVAVAVTAYNINRIVPEPYLDEVFHIPQAQAYCRGAFSTWDPKLTTPAGLYLLSYPLSYLDLCTPAGLRAVNAVGVAILLPVIVYRIQQTLLGKGKASDTISAQTALNVALFPLVYFFGGLFYTDIWSTVFVLAAYLATLRGNRWVSGVFCWVSLWFRQTNVVWVVFMAGVYGVGKLQELQWLESLGEKEETHKLKVALFLDPRQWRKIKIHNPPLNQATTFSDFLLAPLTLVPALLRNLFPVIAALTPYILVLLSFGLFLVTNDLTIALGDKTAHTASLHLPQLLYYIAFTAFFSFPLYLPLIPTFLRSALPLPPLSNAAKKMAVTAVACGVMAAAVQYNTVLHPYLLADNRHYAFYVFRRFLLRSPPWSLLAAVPAYFAAAWLQLLALSTSTPGVGVSWSILYIGATTITLVGAPLVEPRYFIVAWMLWRVHVGERRRLVLAAEMVWFVVVNAGTLYMFLERSFEWAHEAGVTQRFMW